MQRNLFLAALVSATFVGNVFAQTPANNTPKIDARAEHIEKRIDQGTTTGSLTPKEAANLEKREAKPDQNIAEAKADGTVTAKERAKLTHQENKISRKVAHKKHNKRHAS